MSGTTETKLGVPAGAAARLATKRMRLLVTGGTGVLGRAFVPLASAVGHQVIAPARSDLDLFDPAAVGAAVRTADAVLHLATRIQPLEKMQQPDAGARTTGCVPRPRATWSTPR